MPFTSFFQRENFVFKLVAQAIVLIAVVQTFVQRDSPPGPILLFAALLFSVLVWWMPVDSDWRANRYMIVQGVIAFLASLHEFIFVYLFFVLSMQAMLLHNIRPALVWNGIFLALALLVNFLFQLEGDLAPGPRGLAIILAFILAGNLSAGIARTRRDRDEIRLLAAQLAETNTLLQESQKKAEDLAAAEERNRLARELNSSLGHRLTVAIVQLEGAVLQLEKDPGRVAVSLNVVHNQLEKGLAELRRIVKRV